MIITEHRQQVMNCKWINLTNKLNGHRVLHTHISHSLNYFEYNNNKQHIQIEISGLLVCL